MRTIISTLESLDKLHAYRLIECKRWIETNDARWSSQMFFAIDTHLRFISAVCLCELLFNFFLVYRLSAVVVIQSPGITRPLAEKCHKHHKDKKVTANGKKLCVVGLRIDVENHRDHKQPGKSGQYGVRTDIQLNGKICPSTTDLLLPPHLFFWTHTHTHMHEHGHTSLLNRTWWMTNSIVACKCALTTYEPTVTHSTVLVQPLFDFV